MINFFKALKEVSRRNKEQVGETPVKETSWTVEGLVERIYTNGDDELDNIEAVTLNHLKTHVTLYNCDWDQESKYKLEEMGLEWTSGEDMHGDMVFNIHLPVDTFAIVNEGATEMYLVNKEVYGKVTTTEVTKFIQAPKQRFIRIYNHDGSLLYTQESPYLEEELDKLIKASSALSFINYDDEFINIVLSKDMRLETNEGIKEIMGYNNYPLISFNNDIIFLHKTIEVSVKPTYRKRSSITTIRVILSSVNGLSAGDMIKFVNNKENEFEAEVISVNKRDRTIRVAEVPIWLKAGADVIDIANPVNVRAVKSVLGQNVKPKGTNFATVTISGVKEFGSFIRNANEDETVNEVISELLDTRYPNHDTKPYLYWKYDK